MIVASYLLKSIAIRDQYLYDLKNLEKQTELQCEKHHVVIVNVCSFSLRYLKLCHKCEINHNIKKL